MVAERMILGLGAFKILIGFLYLICTIVFNVEVGAPSALTFVGCIPLLAVGVITLLYALKKTKPLLISMLVLSIIVFIILIIGAIVLGIAVGAIDACDTLNNTTINCVAKDNETKVNLLRAFVAFAVFGSMATLASSIIGCARACCKTDGDAAV